jgi:hypothetical protein
MPEDEILDIVVHAHPQHVIESMKKANFRYEREPLQTVIEYLSYVTVLQTDAIEHALRSRGNSSKNDRDVPKKKKQDSKFKTRQCTYCNKLGHTENVCRKKKRDLKKRNNGNQNQSEENHAMEAEPVPTSYDSDEELIQFIKKFDERYPDENEVSEEVYALLPLLSTRNPTLTDTTSSVDLVTEVKVVVKPNSGSNIKTYRVLIDTGCSRTIVRRRVLPDIHFNSKRTSKETLWNTNGGTFLTKYEIPVTFALPEFAPSKEVSWNMAVDETEKNAHQKYDMIIGRDLQQALGFDILWSKGLLVWDGIAVPMKSAAEATKLTKQQEHDFSLDEIYQMYQEGEVLMEATNRAMRILDAKYEKADINQAVNDMDHLSSVQKQQLKALLFKYEHLFDGTLGHWDTEPVDFELKEGAKPYHAKAYPIPHIHEQTLRKEIDRLVKLGVLKKCSDSEWASPTFIIPKKNGTVRVVSDFRKLNSLLKRKPFPIPKIQDVLQKLGGFTFATSLDLNMGYYTIRLTPGSSRLCTIIFPWGKYQYTCLPMGVAGSPDVFQEKMNTLMDGLEFVRCYLDDLLVITKGSFTEHLEKTEQVLKRLSQAGLRVNITKSAFGTQELEYLGYLLTPTGIRPVAKKVEAIQRLEPPKTVRQLRRLLGMVNYYRDMWKRRSHILAPLTALTKKSPKQKLTWGPEQQKAFDEMKAAISADVMLSFPDFEKPFEIHTDASDYQLGSVVMQDGKPIAFYSRKLSSAQRNYTVGEREMLSIVETLKEFRTILLGQTITVYTDHMNLVNPTTNHASARITRWRWLIEEFGPTFEYIKGPKNVVADALSRLQADFVTRQSQHDECLLSESFDIVADDKTLTAVYPLSSKLIAEYQRKDATLKKHLLRHPEYFSKPVEGTELITFHQRIYIPKPLRQRVLEWYHEMLCHPGAKRTERTIRQHLVWPGLSKDVEKFVSTCHQCQIAKTRKQYGHLPIKEANIKPWHTICVDQIGPYSVTAANGKTYELNAMTIVDPATGWFEIVEVPNKKAVTAAILLDTTWLSRYPRPVQCIFDNGNEFTGFEFQEMLESYGITPKPTTVKNPQANFVERVHQTLGNMLRTKELETYTFPADDPWTQILSQCAWAIRSTVHLVLDATPAQLVFGRDMLFDLSFTADWQGIKNRRQQSIDSSNLRENSRRIAHQYRVGDQVLLDRNLLQRKLLPKRDGPFTIQQIYTNGVVKISKGVTTEKVSIRRIVPYNSRHNSGSE